MKTWILIWVLTFQPNNSGFYEWEYYAEADLTLHDCMQLLAKKEHWLPLLENYSGHQIYCKDTSRQDGLKIPIK